MSKHQLNIERNDIFSSLKAQDTTLKLSTQTSNKLLLFQEVIYQTLARVFDHVSKHRERKLKNEVQLNFLRKFEVFGNMIKH